MFCGAAVASRAVHAGERKVVTILFCDLVGSTALGEATDPEDVDLLLRRYNATVRRVVTGFGGTVEKFIGDAVFAVFGVPVVHEDDPERAVRAGLQLIAAIDELPPVAGRRIQVRVGINTGEALVRLDVEPGSGEGFLAGDAVNVGARLQSAAPPMGVVVGALTHRLTRHAIAYEALDAMDAKGKQDPLEAWLATAPQADGAANGPEGVTPFVGRQVELSYLTALVAKAVGASSPQVVLVLGEPGIGKTRLVAEVARHVRESGAPLLWLEGRCQPYGEGQTYAALGQIVRAYAGIVETDEGDQVAAKLAQAVAPHPGGDWLATRLGPLVGLPAPAASRAENHAAWLKFLAGLAESRPLALCVEDLQWADEPSLAFLEFLTVHAGPVPLLTIATARPDLLTVSPSFAASSARVIRLWLERLSDSETVALVRNLPGVDSGDHEVVEAIVHRSEGNPYFAEELARLFNESRADSATTPAATRLPGSVQAVISARVDALSRRAKSCLGDAAVIGDAFRPDALQALGGGQRGEVRGALDELLTRRLVRRSPQRVGEGVEYDFSHGLVREVTYNSLPRRLRAAKHEAYARWVEARAGTHADDFAAVLAHHYATAAELAPPHAEAAAGSDVADRAITYLSLGGDLAMNLDAAVAAGDYARALALAVPGSAGRLLLLTRWAEALVREGRYREAAAALEQAATGLRDAGDTKRAALTFSRLSELRYALGDTGVVGPLRQALDLLDGGEPSAELSTVLARWGKALWFIGDPRAGLEATERALAMSATLGLPEPVAVLGDRGGMRCVLGDAGGHDDYRRALVLAEQQGLEREHGILCFNFSDALLSERGPGAAAEVLEEGIEWARRRRLERMRALSTSGEAESLGTLGDWDAEIVRPLAVNLVESYGFMGRWQEALRTSAELVPQLERGAAGVALLIVRVQQAVLLGCRGEPEQVEPFLGWLTSHARESEIPWMRAYAALAAAPVLLGLGDDAGAKQVLSQWATTPRPGSGPNYVLYMPEPFRAALAVGDLDLARRLPAGVEPVLPVQRHVFATLEALTLEAQGKHQAAAVRFADAAAHWRGFDVPYEEAQALMGRGRCLLALGRAPEAAPVLDEARAVFERLGAAPALEQVLTLLRSPSIARSRAPSPDRGASPRPTV